MSEVSILELELQSEKPAVSSPTCTALLCDVINKTIDFFKVDFDSYSDDELKEF